MGSLSTEKIKLDDAAINFLKTKNKSTARARAYRNLIV